MWPFKPRPLVVNITAHVAQPGDTVLLTTDKPIAVHLRDEFISDVRKVFSDAAVKVIVVTPGFDVEIVKNSAGDTK